MYFAPSEFLHLNTDDNARFAEDHLSVVEDNHQSFKGAGNTILAASDLTETLSWGGVGC